MFTFPRLLFSRRPIKQTQNERGRGHGLPHFDLYRLNFPFSLCLSSIEWEKIAVDCCDIMQLWMV